MTNNDKANGILDNN